MRSPQTTALWNSSWYAVEEGGAPQAGDWTVADNKRLHALVDHAHKMGIGCAFMRWMGLLRLRTGAGEWAITSARTRPLSNAGKWQLLLGQLYSQGPVRGVSYLPETRCERASPRIFRLTPQLVLYLSQHAGLGKLALRGRCGRSERRPSQLEVGTGGARCPNIASHLFGGIPHWQVRSSEQRPTSVPPRSRLLHTPHLWNDVFGFFRHLFSFRGNPHFSEPLVTERGS